MAKEENNILKAVDPNRRDFVRRVIAGAAFAAPLIATFSIDSLTMESASAQTVSNMPNQGCPADVGYVGPSSFQAHVSVNGGRSEESDDDHNSKQLVARINGEASFVVAGPQSNRLLQTTLTMVPGVTVLKAYVLVGGSRAATLVVGSSTIGASSLLGNSLCDVDELLESMASDHASVEVDGSYLGKTFTATGSIRAGNASITQ